MKIKSTYFILPIASVIFTLILIELMLRSIGFSPSTHIRKFSQFDPMLGWSKIPNADGKFRRGDVVIYEKFNSFGLRSPELTPSKDSNALRVLFLGDSFTEGYDVNEELLFTTLTQTTLQKNWPHKKIEIINGGTGGYSTDQEYIFLKHVGLQFKPDIVMLMMYPTNDVYYNIQTRYGSYDKPVLSIRNNSLDVINTPLNEPKKAESFKSIFRETALYQFTLTRLLPAFPGLTTMLAKTGLVSRETAHIATDKGKAPASFGIFDIQSKPEIDSAWAITYRIIEQMQSLCDSANATFILASIPDRFQLYEQDWNITQTRYNVTDSIWSRSKPEALLYDHARLFRYDFINLLDSLKKDPDNSGMYNAVHINEKGNAKVARILSNHLVNRFPAGIKP